MIFQKKGKFSYELTSRMGLVMKKMKKDWTRGRLRQIDSFRLSRLFTVTQSRSYFMKVMWISGFDQNHLENTMDSKKYCKKSLETSSLIMKFQHSINWQCGQMLKNNGPSKYLNKLPLPSECTIATIKGFTGFRACSGLVGSSYLAFISTSSCLLAISPN